MALSVDVVCCWAARCTRSLSPLPRLPKSLLVASVTGALVLMLMIVVVAVVVAKPLLLLLLFVSLNAQELVWCVYNNNLGGEKNVAMKSCEKTGEAWVELYNWSIIRWMVMISQAKLMTIF